MRFSQCSVLKHYQCATPDVNSRLAYTTLPSCSGFVAVSKESIRYILNESKGNVLSIVVGGAQEVFYAVPGNSVLRLEGRMGFVKMAIQQG